MSLERFRAVIFDVNGVITDGMKYYSSDGSVFLAFNVKDGVTLDTLAHEKITVIVTSANTSPAIEFRMKDLVIIHYFLGCRDKADKAGEILRSLRIDPERTAVVGDDLTDIALFDFCGLSIAPSDAASLVKERADIVFGSQAG